MIKTDMLTISRVSNLLRDVGINDLISGGENIMMSTIMLSQLDSSIIDKICDVIGIDITLQDVDKIEHVSRFFTEIELLMNKYSSEIDSRKKHAKDVLKLWKDDGTEPDDDNLYRGDYYINCFYLLSREHIDPTILNLYESLILVEEISCDKAKDGIYQMLAMLEDEHKTFVKIIKDAVKHANFNAFVLDIYQDVEKMYNEMIEKDKKKK